MIANHVRQTLCKLHLVSCPHPALLRPCQDSYCSRVEHSVPRLYPCPRPECRNDASLTQWQDSSTSMQNTFTVNAALDVHVPHAHSLRIVFNYMPCKASAYNGLMPAQAKRRNNSTNLHISSSLCQVHLVKIFDTGCCSPSQ